MLNEDQRTRMIQGLAEAKQQLRARGLAGGVIYRRLEHLETSPEPQLYELAESILQDLPLEANEERRLGSTEPEGYKALRDVLNEIVSSRETDEKTVGKPGPADKSTAYSTRSR